MPRAEHAHHARQRRQLPALHAVPAGGRGRHARAAPRRHAAARRARADAPAARRRDRPRRRAPRPSRCATRRAPSTSFTTTSWSSRSDRSRGCCRSPGLGEHAIGFKSLADAIWLRNHVIQCLELADATEDPRVARSCSRSCSWAAATPGSRRSPSYRTSRPRRWSSTRARACTACAGSWSRRRTACCPRSTRELADYAAAGAAQPRHRHPARDDARGGDRAPRRGSRPARRSPPARSSGPPASSPHPAAATSGCRSTSAAGSWSTITCACGRGRRLGARRRRRRARPAPARRRPARRPRSTRSARARPRPATSPPRSASAAAPFSYKTRGSS